MLPVLSGRLQAGLGAAPAGERVGGRGSPTTGDGAGSPCLPLTRPSLPSLADIPASSPTTAFSSGKQRNSGSRTGGFSIVDVFIASCGHEMSQAGDAAHGAAENQSRDTAQPGLAWRMISQQAVAHKVMLAVAVRSVGRNRTITRRGARLIAAQSMVIGANAQRAVNHSGDHLRRCKDSSRPEDTRASNRSEHGRRERVDETRQRSPARCARAHRRRRSQNNAFQTRIFVTLGVRMR